MVSGTPLVRPDRFFAERSLHPTRLFVVVTVLVLSGPATVWGVGWVLTDHLDGTVMVDNPERPPDSYCRNAPESMAEGCDRPAEVERNADAVLWEAVGRFVLPSLFGFPFALLVVGGLLHVGSWMLGGENGATESFAVAAWGLLPQVFGILALLALLAVALDPVAVTPDTDVAAMAESVRADVRLVGQWRPVVVGATAVWGGAIWLFGLEHERGLARVEAAGLAGSVVLLVWLFSIA